MAGLVNIDEPDARMSRAEYRRRDGERLETRVLTRGVMTLEPSGIVVPLIRFHPNGGIARATDRHK